MSLDIAYLPVVKLRMIEFQSCTRMNEKKGEIQQKFNPAEWLTGPGLRDPQVQNKNNDCSQWNVKATLPTFYGWKGC